VGSNAQTQRRFERSAVTLTRMEVMRTGEVCGLEIHESDFHSAAGCPREGGVLVTALVFPLAGHTCTQAHRLHALVFHRTLGCLRGGGALLHAGRSRRQARCLRGRGALLHTGRSRRQASWPDPPGLAKVIVDSMTVHRGEDRFSLLWALPITGVAVPRHRLRRVSRGAPVLRARFSGAWSGGLVEALGASVATRASLVQEDKHFRATLNLNGEEYHRGNVNVESELFFDNMTAENHVDGLYPIVHRNMDKAIILDQDFVIQLYDELQHEDSEGEGAQARLRKVPISGDSPHTAEGSDDKEVVAISVGKVYDPQVETDLQYKAAVAARAQVCSRMAFDLGKHHVIQLYNELQQVSNEVEGAQASLHMVPISGDPPHTADGNYGNEAAIVFGQAFDPQLFNERRHKDGDVAREQVISRMEPAYQDLPHNAPLRRS